MSRTAAARVTGWFSAMSPRTQDVALAVALAAYNVGSLVPEVHQLKLPYLAFMLVVLQTLPLAWRGQWPVIVWLAVGIPRTLYDDLGISYAPLPLASMITYYTVMDRCSTRTRWLVSIATLAGISKSATLPNMAYDFFVGALSSSAPQACSGPSAAPGVRTWPRWRRGPRGGVRTTTGTWRWPPRRSGPRCARELHDVVAHHVSLMAVQSEAAASLLPGRPAEAGKAVEIIGQTAREALAELRQLLGLLREPTGSVWRRLWHGADTLDQSLEEVLGQVRRPGSPWTSGWRAAQPGWHLAWT